MHRSLKSYSVTENEMALFKYIHYCHTNDLREEILFDNTKFKYIVRLDDVRQFYDFMKTCYGKMMNQSTSDDSFGYLKIDSNFVVPYCVKDGRKYIPAVCLEHRQNITLGSLSVEIKGWHLAYLKFLFKAMGAKEEVYASDSLLVVSIDVLKPYMNRLTHFEEIWPQRSKFFENVLNIDGLLGLSHSSGPGMHTALEVSRKSKIIHFYHIALLFYLVVCTDIRYYFVV